MAGLIPQAFIDDLLSRVDIVDVIDKRIKLKKTGKNYSALCPFHKEKSPSFSVEPEKQFYYCFGCGAAGNALGFVMNYDRHDFPQAVESLASSCGLTVPREEGGPSRRRQSEHKEIYEALDKASAWYQQQLRQHPAKSQAVDYLKKRGLTGQVARQFAIGYAPPGWDNLLKHMENGGTEPALLVKSGLIIERDAESRANSPSYSQAYSPFYDRFRERIIFPIRDSRGRVIAFGGRVLGDDKPKYLNSPETPVFHKANELYGLYEARQVRQKLSRVLIVEGYMDVVALAQHGINNAVATLGTATSQAHLTRLFRLVPEVVFCFDGDQAGRNAAWRALENALPLMTDGRQVRFLFLPEGEDPDSLVRSVGQEEFTRKIDGATHLADFFFDKLSVGLDLDSISGKSNLSNLAIPLLRKFPRGVFAQLMLDRLTQLTGVDKETIKSLLAGSPAQPGGRHARPSSGTASSDPYSAYPESQGAGEAPSSEPWPPAEAYLARDDAEFDAGSNGHASPPSGSALAGSGSGAGAGAGRSAARPRPESTLEYRKKYRKSAGLKAIELLLYRPEVALAVDKDLEPLRQNGGEDHSLLVELIELAKNDPNTTTYTMLGHCYGTPLGTHLTQLMKNEKITPADGVQDEFDYLLDRMLSEVRKQQLKMELIERLRPRLRSSTQTGKS